MTRTAREQYHSMRYWVWWTRSVALAVGMLSMARCDVKEIQELAPIVGALAGMALVWALTHWSMETECDAENDCGDHR